MSGPDDSSPDASAPADEEASPEKVWRPSPKRALKIALVTTAVVTATSLLAPDAHANLLVGAAFLGATWYTVFRRNTATLRHYGLALAGITEPTRLDPRRIAVAAGRAIVWCLVLALVIYPPFWFGYRYWWGVDRSFAWQPDLAFVELALTQLLVIALPEEAFYRGFLQTALEDGWPNKSVNVLGAKLGAGWLVSAALFAVGHVLTIPHPSRLAVFFPALLFGWMRQRSGGIGAAVLFHAMCNLLTGVLADGYGLR